MIATVLIVDNDVEILHSVRATLAAAMPEVSVLSARSGRQGLELLRNGGIDAIVSDLKMPAMDGLEFLAAAKAMRPWTPAALMTAHRHVQSDDQAWRSADAKRVLLKPFTPDELVETLRGLLQGRIKRPRRAPSRPAAWKRNSPAPMVA